MDKDFSLHNTVSSLELMDPKMDSGMNYSKILSLKAAEEKNLLIPSSELKPETVLFLMDKLLIAELLHYQGHTLIQTLYSCYYIHEPIRLLKDHPLLLSFVLATLRRSYLIRESIVLADNYEEEDFIYYTFGFDFCINDYTDDEVISMLSEQIKILQSNNERTEIETAILNRLLFCKHFTCTQLHFNKYNYAEAKITLNDSLQYIQPIIDSHHFGQDPENENIKLFEPELSRIAIHSSCPKPITWYPMEECMKIYKEMIERFLETTDLPSIELSFLTLEKKLYDFSERSEHLLPARSRFLLTIFYEKKIFGKYSGEDVAMKDAIHKYSIPEEVFSDDPKNTNVHLGKMVNAIVHLFKAIGNNHSRRRRKLRKVLIEWSHLIQDGDALDTQMNIVARRPKEDFTHYFAYWQIDNALRIVKYYLIQGFELDMYEEYELPTIFWYLDNVMFTRYQNYLTHLAHIIKLKQKKIKLQQLKNKKKKIKEPIEEPKPPRTPYLLELESKFYIVRGLYKYIAALDWYKKIKHPTTELSSEQTLFFCRFRRISEIDYLPTFRYTQFKQKYIDVIRNKVTDGSVLLNGAIDLFKKSQDSIKQWTMSTDQKTSDLDVKDGRSLLRIAITNAVNIQKVKKDHDNPNLSIHLDFSINPHFPVMSLKEI